MKIHVISDVHLELRASTPPFPSVNGDVCILAGDITCSHNISEYVNYINIIKNKFTQVIFVAGNHEFYHSFYKDTIDNLSKIARKSNSIFLDYYTNPSVTIDGVKFWGSTLWTDLNKDNPLTKEKVRVSINDYKLVKGLTPDATQSIHQDTVESIEWDSDIIISHHCPLDREHTNYPFNDISYSFYCMDMRERIEESKVKYWVYGHTHDNVWDKVGTTNVITNQVGYPLEHINKDYNPSLIIEVV